MKSYVYYVKAFAFDINLRRAYQTPTNTLFFNYRFSVKSDLVKKIA